MWAREIVAITDSRICKGDLLERIELLAQSGVKAIILREKQLEPSAYTMLAKQALAICASRGVACILHSFIEVARELKASALHCQSSQIAHLPHLRAHFRTLGVSVHSVEEYRAAKEWVDYVIIGHIFASSCKVGVEPKGLKLLESIITLESNFAKIDSRDKPALQGLYAIGGISLETLPALANMPISGVCMRQALMQTPNPEDYIRDIMLL
ncbi:thiamine phosphate synthase [Helicobacter canis]|uniref:thiamine phosphate synthase n=1 Tax=Helicobacter canis TaxID=29419 RepID=UPI0026EEE86F|nr:thiamine phosphate synthase [Helicobacter canis]